MRKRPNWLWFNIIIIIIIIIKNKSISEIKGKTEPAVPPQHQYIWRPEPETPTSSSGHKKCKTMAWFSPLSHFSQRRSSRQHWAHKNGLTWVKITMQFHRRKCHHHHQHYQHQHHHQQQQRWAHTNGLTCVTNTVLYLDFGIFDTHCHRHYIGHCHCHHHNHHKKDDHLDAFG